ncbi:hypothetical protein [Rubrivirga sp. IMCC45206]|uniref:hypothetical protein n=1 Tax=Rubrivirga sp. IMCC45206 TaxID=3391614 RepID=UPI0039902CE1
MPDALLPIRHVYDVEPAHAAPSGVESAVLGEMRDLLATGPTHAPSDAALSAVLARAAEATGLPSPPLEARSAAEAALFDQSRAALDRLPRSRPEPEGVAAVEAFAALAPALTARQSPSAAAVAAVLARAAEPAGEPLTADSPVEAAVLDQSLAALDQLPRTRPEAETLAAVLAFAAQPSDPLAAVRGVYLGETAAPSVEGRVLEQSREIVERAFAALPQPRPTADAVAAVLARAAEPTDATALDARSPIEVAVLAQSLLALDRLPRPRPAAASLDAVRLAAATASAPAAAPVAAPVPAPPATAPAVPNAFLQNRFGAWAGGAALVLAALAAVVVLPQGGPADAETTVVAAVAEPAPVVEEAAPAPPEADAAEPVAADPLPRPSSAGTASAASGLFAAAERVVPRPAPAPPPAARPDARATTPPTAFAAASTPSARAATPRAAGAAPVPSWEASDDVRALSLRLQDLDDADALAWDAAPAEAFGRPAGTVRGATLGLQSVREGAPALPPARARIRPDSLR